MRKDLRQQAEIPPKLVGRAHPTKKMEHQRVHADAAEMPQFAQPLAADQP